MEKKKVSLFAVICTSICAVIWNILVLIDLYYGHPDNDSFILHIICAIAWDFSAGVWILKYIKSKKENQ